jgi:hypothetical protein
VALFPERDTRVQIPSITPTGEVMHLMLDIETMGNKANAAIASIGAVAFDPDAQDTLASRRTRSTWHGPMELPSITSS